MKSYEILNQISQQLYINYEPRKDIRVRLEKQIDNLHSEISSDFKTLFGQELKLTSFHLFINDVTYRQSATGIVMYSTVESNEEFKIYLECLIDHGRIWLKVKEKPQDPVPQNIVKRIEKVKNIEGLSELREIK